MRKMLNPPMGFVPNNSFCVNSYNNKFKTIFGCVEELNFAKTVESKYRLHLTCLK